MAHGAQPAPEVTSQFHRDDCWHGTEGIWAAGERLEPAADAFLARPGASRRRGAAARRAAQREQMERHGKLLAQAHELRPTPAPDRLLKRLAENEAALLGTCNLLVAATAANRRIGPSGEWLLDNFYLLEEQIRTAKRHLPQGYSAQLPQLRERSLGRAASRLRHRARSDRARRRARRSREPEPFHRGLPDASRRSSSASCGRYRSCCGSR